MWTNTTKTTWTKYVYNEMIRSSLFVVIRNLMIKNSKQKCQKLKNKTFKKIWLVALTAYYSINEKNTEV